MCMTERLSNVTECFVGYTVPYNLQIYVIKIMVPYL